VERYNGSVIVPSSGPDDAEIVIVLESPSDREVAKGEPAVGPAGNYLNLGLKRAALARQDIKLMNLVPVQPAGNKFKNHNAETLQWGLARFEEEIATLKPKIVVAAGASALKHLTGLTKISDWRGSLLHPEHWPLVELRDNKGNYVAPPHPQITARDWPIMPTFHPSFILQSHNFSLTWWLRLDLERARKYCRGEWDWQYEDREWNLIGDLEKVEAFVNRLVDHPLESGDLVAIDTENEPWPIISIADDWEVHSFAWHEKYRPIMTKLLSSQVMKIAHNLNHDATFLTKRLGLPFEFPYVDTMGLAHILDPEMRKGLSPECSTRFTSWPYHKWMWDTDAVAYCGLDTACAFDIYWGEFGPISKEKLWDVVQFDHRLQHILMKMQWRGVTIDEGARAEVENELKMRLNAHEDVLREVVKPIIAARWQTFKKPHLFYIEKRCECCVGGKVSRQHCWRCSGLAEKPKVKADYIGATIEGYGCRGQCGCTNCEHDLKPRIITEDNISEFLLPQIRAALPQCKTCKGTGKIGHWLPFNPESTEQVADVIYRGLGIRPRTYMNKETVRTDRLGQLVNKHPLIKQYVDTQNVRSEYRTVLRQSPVLPLQTHPRTLHPEHLIMPGLRIAVE